MVASSRASPALSGAGAVSFRAIWGEEPLRGRGLARALMAEAEAGRWAAAW